MYKIIADENIVFAKQAFSCFGEVKLFPGRELSNRILQDADILIVRSITKVNEELIRDTKLKFVGTATTGNDHIDQEILKQKNIYFADAKGCNADSVTEYVFTALFKLASENYINLKNKTIGVIGIGNIGSRVCKLAEAIGMKVLKNDPPLERSENKNKFGTLDEVLQADIITLHVPLTLSGIDKTYHLLNKENLIKVKEGSILINTSRGEVIDNSALFEIRKSKNIHLILDVWENEPDIKKELLKISDIGTAHIAGYSYEGKVNGTKLIFDALCKFTGKAKDWNQTLPVIINPIREINFKDRLEKNLYNLFSSIYNIDYDDAGLKKVLLDESGNTGKHFDKLRKEYPLRREFNNYKINVPERNDALVSLLKKFRFDVDLV